MCKKAAAQVTVNKQKWKEAIEGLEIESSVGLVPTNALVVIKEANSRMVGYPEVIHFIRSSDCLETRILRSSRGPLAAILPLFPRLVN